MALVLSVAAASAQKVVNVDHTYTYHASSSESLNEAKAKALQNAQTEAVESVFGTMVTAVTSTVIKNSNDTSGASIMTHGESEVRGEWLETIGEPQYEIDYADGKLVVTVRVKGKVREVVRTYDDIQAIPLKNGTDPRRYQSNLFRTGDDMYLYFRSPVDGYLTVYLMEDDSDDVACLLPYYRSSGEAYKVSKDTDYIFFSKASAPQEERRIVDEYTMKCDSHKEINNLYVVFSPHPYSKAHLKQAGSYNDLAQLSQKDFLKWLSKLKSKDSQACSKVVSIILED